MTDEKILEIFEDYFGYEYPNLQKEGVLDFLKEVKGVKLEKLEDVIINTQNPKNIYMFAKYIKGANIKKLQNAILNYREDIGLYDFYVSKFAKNINGANVNEIINTIIKNGFCEHVAYELIKDVKDIDVEKLENIVISVAKEKEDPFKIIYFLEKVKGANKKRLMEVFEEIESKRMVDLNINQ